MSEGAEPPDPEQVRWAFGEIEAGRGNRPTVVRTLAAHLAASSARGYQGSSATLATVRALGRTGRTEAIAPLIPHLRSSWRMLSHTARVALSRLGRTHRGDLRSALGAAGLLESPTGIEALIAAGDPSAAADLWKMADRWPEYAVEQVGRLRPPGALAALLAWADHPYDSVRREAVEALGKLHEPEARAAVAARLEDPDFRVRSEARRALGKHCRREVTPEVAALAGSESVEHRSLATFVLSCCDDPAADALLARLSTDSDERVRVGAQRDSERRARAKIGKPQAALPTERIASLDVLLDWLRERGEGAVPRPATARRRRKMLRARCPPALLALYGQVGRNVPGLLPVAPSGRPWRLLPPARVYRRDGGWSFAVDEGVWLLLAPEGVRTSGDDAREVAADLESLFSEHLSTWLHARTKPGAGPVDGEPKDPTGAPR